MQVRNKWPLEKTTVVESQYKPQNMSSKYHELSYLKTNQTNDKANIT